MALLDDFKQQPLRILAAAAIFIGFFLNIYAVPLFDVDEGAFSEATREMFARGDFISTYLNGEPRYDKPILIYWLQAAAVTVFGVNEFAFRLPSALAATAWVLALIWFVRRLRDEQTALLAGIMASTALSLVVIGSAATADALLNLFIAGAMFAIYLYFIERKTGALYLAFACMGLGFLTKGPVALLIPVAVSFIFFAWEGELRTWARAAFNPIGWVILLGIAMPWYLVQYAKEGQAFIDGFFLKHNVSRFQGPMEGHTGSLLYYLPVVVVGIMPYSSLAIRTVTYLRQMPQVNLQWFCLLWFAFVLVFFSLSGTKLPHYVNYGLTGLIILMALYMDALRSRFWAFLPPLVFFAVFLSLPEILGAVLPMVEDPYFQASFANYEEYFGWGYRLFFLAALAMTLYFMAERQTPVANKLLITGLVTALSISGVFMPKLGAILQEPVKEAGLLARAQALDVVQYRLHLPSISVYRQAETPRRAPRPGEVALTAPAYLDELGPHDVIFASNGIVLARLREEGATDGPGRQRP